MRAAFSIDAREPGRERGARAAGTMAALVLGSLFTLLAPVPFLSEDWTQLAAMGAVPTLFEAFDPAREPLRPLQHAFFWVLAHTGLDPAGAWLPAWARAFAFLLHAGACLAVLGLARAAGLGLRASAGALLLFAVFPNVKMLSWAAAIGSPGRVPFELAAILFLVRRLRGGGTATGAAGVAALVVALGFHESAFLTPLLVLAWVACVGAGTLGAGLLRARRALADPFLASALVIAGAHVVYLAFLRPERHHGLKDLASIPANVVKAAFALAPEGVRTIAVEGFRGNAGTLGWIAAGAAFAAVCAIAVYALRRGGLLRFAVIGIALDLGLAVAGAGFVQRYACLASALCALAVARWATTRTRSAFAVLIGAAWAANALTDALEIRRAGEVALAVAADARAARDLAGPGVEIGIVDLPDMVGAEEDVPAFNWGAARFLEAHGARGPWLLMRTVPFRTNTDVELVDRNRIEAHVRTGRIVLSYDGRGLR